LNPRGAAGKNPPRSFDLALHTMARPPLDMSVDANFPAVARHFQESAGFRAGKR
jgi:hypothetical protein